MLERLPEAFQAPGGRRPDEETASVPELYEQIGRLQVELEWLQKKHEALGG